MKAIGVRILAIAVSIVSAFGAGGVGGAERELAEKSISDSENYGPQAALSFARRYRGELCTPGTLYCYPAARGIPLSDTAHIIGLTASLWTPAQLAADFKKRMASVPERERKKGIIVMLKTERCATKAMRACSVTTAALEKRSTPLIEEFLIYGVQLKPRDGDVPSGRLSIETGADAWKNQAAGEYGFRQGPGATLVFIDPGNAAKLARTDALALCLTEMDFELNQGRTPALEEMLGGILKKIIEPQKG